MTAGFTRLSVSGFRRLKRVDLRLQPLNVLIGPNGVGKSSLLEIFDVLAASASGQLESTITDLGGLASLLTRDGETNALTFLLRSDTTDKSGLGYDLRIVSQGISYAISDEELGEFGSPPLSSPVKYLTSFGSDVSYFHNGESVHPNWDYRPRETALSQVPRTYQKAEAFRRQLADVSEMYHTLDVSVRSPVRTPQPLAPAQTPGINGEDLASCLLTIRETNQDRFEAIEDTLRVAFPDFERLEFPPISTGRLLLRWRERKLSGPIEMGELSEGTLRFLWLATLLQSPGLPKVTLIDEPEVSLHPEMLRLLADLMREATARTQLIVATHSDRFVRFLEPEELIVCDRDDSGGMTVQRADELDLKAWMEDYTLDQLWSKGIIGGRS